MRSEPSTAADTAPGAANAEAPLPAVRRGAEFAVIVGFLVLVASSLVLQTATELRSGRGVRALEVFRQRPTAANLRAFERSLEDASVVARAARPWFQHAQFLWLNDGGEKALVGQDGWLFYKPGCDAAVKRPAPRETVPKEAVDAIVAWRDALEARGIRLLVVPAPNKESVYPDRLTRRMAGSSGVVPPATRELFAGLRSAGVEFVDLFETFRQARANEGAGPATPLYLTQDSHWSPAGVNLAARTVARRLTELGWAQPGAVDYRATNTTVERLGDIVRMLQSPSIERRVPPETVACERVLQVDGAAPYHDDVGAPILVLGDSFLRIYERDEPGAAGLVAHLAKELQQPLASLVNDGGASTLVRQELHRRPALLANKRVVVWEFVERDLRLGTEGWQQVPLPPPAPVSGKQAVGSAASRERLRVRISFGHGLSDRTSVTPHLSPGADGVEVTAAERTLAVGGGTLEAVTAEVSWVQREGPPRQPQEIWSYLFEHGEPGQVARLKNDPGLALDAPVLTVATAADGSRGFSVGLDQLRKHRALWLPEHHAFVTLAEAPVDFAAHLASLTGKRVLDRARTEPEASLDQWRSRWEDIGNPLQWSQPFETTWMGVRGHLVGTVARHGSLYKFGIDRWARVRPDYASPHRFRLDPVWSGWNWAGQRIVDGLPLVETILERAGQRCEVEQFAATPDADTAAGSADEPTAFYTRVRLSGSGPIHLAFRFGTVDTNRHPECRDLAGRFSVVDRETGSVWLRVEPGPGLTVRERATVGTTAEPQVEFECVGELAAGQPRLLTLRLAAPVVPAAAATGWAAEDFDAAWARTRLYWEGWLARGARFEAPERAVNDLFRANLWHALMLPRHRTNDQGGLHLDLPYSNFAYGQVNADWPINQAVYVDYMLYGLRGHFAVAEQELASMYRTQQKADGRVGGFAEWGVYSPGMLYAVGQNFLLSQDRAAFDRLLPASLKALDWCLAEVAQSQTNRDAPGLIVAPLNDLTHEVRAWAFPNAYFVAGLDVFGRALARVGYPRADAVSAAARRMQADVERAFARGSVRSPVVQLADGTWINYVPCDALTPRRLLEQWYPTDVDCGPLHLARLSAIDPRGWLAAAMLHDHEDNLFLRQQGAANEPVYNQQAATYLLRDEPEAAIRAFYSMMACAFSHHQLSPLEHRWAWGQYYGPPSTDGAWFELYRNLLLNELGGNDSLFVGQGIPRAWLADGKRVSVKDAPTYFGPVSLRLESAAATGMISGSVEFKSQGRPAVLRVRLRHPDRKPLRSVTVNGVDWKDYDVTRELVQIPAPTADRYTVVARYE